jgi:hypothetical protein
VAGIAALGLGFNTGVDADVAGATSSLVIGDESGCETPLVCANKGAVASTKAAVVMRSVMAISS